LTGERRELSHREAFDDDFRGWMKRDQDIKKRENPTKEETEKEEEGEVEPGFFLRESFEEIYHKYFLEFRVIISRKICQSKQFWV
jgi:hypothetical protein